MESKYVGIIVQRQDKKILYHDESYYIRVRINEYDDIYTIIEKTLEKEIELKLFKLKRQYDEIGLYKNKSPFQKNNDIDTIYIVEVCLYHDNYDFLTKLDIYEKLYNCPEKLFFEKYFVRYEKYVQLLQYNFVSLIMILITIAISTNISIPQNQILEMFIYILILMLVGFYIFIIPKIAIIMLDYIIDDKLIKYSNISLITIGLLSLVVIATFK